MKFYKVVFSEPSVNGATKEENISYQTPTITAKAIYRLSDGKSYAYADTESGYENTDDAWYSNV